MYLKYPSTFYGVIKNGNWGNGELGKWEMGIRELKLNTYELYIVNFPHGIPRLCFIAFNDLPCFYNYHLDTHNKIDTSYSLTYRKKEILKLIVTVFKSKEIAEKLHRSIFTITNHIKKILRKMG